MPLSLILGVLRCYLDRNFMMNVIFLSEKTVSTSIGTRNARMRQYPGRLVSSWVCNHSNSLVSLLFRIQQQLFLYMYHGVQTGILYPIQLSETTSEFCQTLRWNFLQKCLAAFSRLLFLQKASSQMFDKVLYAPLYFI